MSYTEEGVSLAVAGKEDKFEMDPTRGSTTPEVRSSDRQCSRSSAPIANTLDQNNYRTTKAKNKLNRVERMKKAL